MSIGDLPRGYDAWRTRTPWDDYPDHHADCPSGEDAQDLYSECGGRGGCECYPDTWWGRLRRLLFDGGEYCVVVEDPDCTCPTPEDIAEDRADAAEARRDAELDR